MKLPFSALILSGLLLFAPMACSDGESATGEDKPRAIGKVGDIIVITDSITWQGQAGEAVRAVFEQSLPGLPDAEPAFKLRPVNPFALNRFLKTYRNLIFLTDLSVQTPEARRMRDFFSAESLARIEEDTSLFRTVARNQYAQGQLVMRLFGVNNAQLTAHVRHHADELRQQFQQAERESIQQAACQQGERTLTAQMRQQQGGAFCLPKNYAEVANTEGFAWYRSLKGTDISYVMATRPYTDPAQFHPDSLLAWRDQIGRSYLFGSGQPDTVSYMMRQDYLEPSVQEVNFNGAYAVEMRGLWKLKNNQRGGVYISYALADEVQQRQYYLEAFVYNPSDPKRGPIMEAEAVLRTFRFRPQEEAVQ